MIVQSGNDAAICVAEGLAAPRTIRQAHDGGGARASA